MPMSSGVDCNLSLAVSCDGGQEPSIGDMASDSVSQPSGGNGISKYLLALIQLNCGQSIYDRNLILAARGVRGQEPSIGDMGSDNVSLHSRGMETLKFLNALSQLNHAQGVHDVNLNLAVAGVGRPASSICDIASNNVSKASKRMETLKFLRAASRLNHRQDIHDWKLSFAVGGARSQAPSIGDMARDSVSQPSEGIPTYPFSGHESLQHELGKIAVLDNQKIYTTAASESDTLFHLAMETGSQKFIHEGNSSHDVRVMVSGQAPSNSDMARESMSSGGAHSYSSDHSAPSWNALNKRDSSPIMIDSDNVQEFTGVEFGSQHFIHEGNSSHEVGDMVSGHQPLSVSDMAMENMSSGGMYTYSRDHSAPSWNALNKRDSSPMMIDSYSVQESMGGKFGWHDFSEVSSKA